MKKLIAVIALASGIGAAYADQPVALTDVQMDNVSAGVVGSTAETSVDVLNIGFIKVKSDSYTNASASWFGKSTEANAYVGLTGFGATAASIDTYANSHL